MKEVRFLPMNYNETQFRCQLKTCWRTISGKSSIFPFLSRIDVVTVFLRNLGTLHDKKFATEVLKSEEMLVLPSIANVKRIAYTIYEWDDLMDSSNMTMEVIKHCRVTR